MSRFHSLPLRCAAFAVVVPCLSLLSACAGDEPVAVAQDVKPTTSAVALPNAAQAALYVCPMHPHITSPVPGSCPICGMTLVLRQPLVAATTSSQAANAIQINAAVIQSLGIRTAHAMRHDVRATVRVPARVVADARGEVRLQSRVDGYIEKLHVRNIGARVAVGEVIAEIYAPDLVQAQEELLIGAETAQAASERLRRYGIAERDIEAVRVNGKSSRRMPLRAPASGVITAIGVREGSSVGRDDVIMELAASAGRRVEAQLFPAQRLLLGPAPDAHFSLPGMPQTAWVGQQAQWLPVLDPVTQTLALRFQLDDGGDLPLGSVLDAEITGAQRSAVLLVPNAAVIRTRDATRVMREDGDGAFAAVTVVTGMRYGDDIEIIKGLDEHDRIVVSGQFLLDSEAQLHSALPTLQVKASSASGHDHD